MEILLKDLRQVQVQVQVLSVEYVYDVSVAQYTVLFSKVRTVESQLVQAGYSSHIT
jgi:hypothetical protein